MISNRSVPTDTVLPHIVYQDVEEAISWLTEAFGFIEHYRHGDPVSGAQMRIGNAWVMLSRARDGRTTPKSCGAWTQSLTIFVENVGAHFEHSKLFGVRIVEDLHETVYGELQYGAQDFAGHHWLFSRHATDLSPEEWGATVSR